MKLIYIKVVIHLYSTIYFRYIINKKDKILNIKN